MRLYKYLHPDRIDILQKLKIRFTSPNDLNDPFELQLSFKGLATKEELIAKIDEGLPELLETEYRKLPVHVRMHLPRKKFLALARAHRPAAEAQLVEMANLVTPMLSEQMSSRLRREIGMLCLTESPTNLLMWAHYADSHRGFLIEFNEKSSIFNARRGENDEFGFLRKVQYQESRPWRLASEMNGVDAFLTKGQDWGYEAEWRILAPLQFATSVLQAGEQQVHLFDLPADAINGVVIGCRASPMLRESLLQTIAENQNLQHVQISEASISGTEYKVEIHPRKA